MGTDMNDEKRNTIVVADDHAVLREGLRALLQQNPDWMIVGEASDGVEMLDLVGKLTPQVVILDLAMPNLGGLEALRRLNDLETKPAVLVLSARMDERSAYESLRAGASGFIPKTADIGELLFALSSVSKGLKYLSPSICAGVLEHKHSDDSNTINSTLSEREQQIAKLLCKGIPNREIARKLCISPRTVDSHRANILKKLGISSNAELTSLFAKCGLVD